MVDSINSEDLKTLEVGENAIEGSSLKDGTKRKVNGKGEELPEFLQDMKTRDIIILWGFIFSFVYFIAMTPFTTFFMNHPWWAALIGGGNNSLIVSGAHYHSDHHWLGFPIIVASISALKFLPLYWGAGRYWGDEYINMSFKTTPRMIKWVERLENFASKNLILSIFLVNIPLIPLSNNLLALIVGNSKVSLKRYLMSTLIVCAIANSIWFYLGYRFGHTVMKVIDKIDHYSTYVLVIIIAYTFYSIGKNRRRSSNVAS